MKVRTDRSPSRTGRWTGGDEHLFARDAPWTQERFHLSAERVSRQFEHRELALSDSTGRVMDRMSLDSDVSETAPSEIPEAAGQPFVMEAVTTESLRKLAGHHPSQKRISWNPWTRHRIKAPRQVRPRRRAEAQLTTHSIEGYLCGLRSFDGDHAAEHTAMSMALGATNNDAPEDTIDDDRRRCDYHTGKLLDRDKYVAGRKKELVQMEAFGEIQSVKTSEATDGTHVRMKVIAAKKGDLVCWRHVSMEVNQHERPVNMQALPH